MVSTEVTPVKAPVVETTKAEELRENVSSVPLPMVIVFAATPVPRRREPVEPESTVMEEDVVEEIAPTPAKVRAVAEVAIVSMEATPVKAPPIVRFKPVEANDRESRVSPIVMVSASALVPMVTVSQPAELQMEAEVALVLPKVRAPEVERSKLLAETVPVVVMLSAPVSIAPKPEVIEPASRAPVPVIAVATASLVSTKAASWPSKRASSAALMVTAFKTMVELELPVRVRVSKAEPRPMMSAVVLSVPMLMVFPAVPVPRLTVPVVPESRVRTAPAADETVMLPVDVWIVEPVPVRVGEPVAIVKRVAPLVMRFKALASVVPRTAVAPKALPDWRKP